MLTTETTTAREPATRRRPARRRPAQATGASAILADFEAYQQSWARLKDIHADEHPEWGIFHEIADRLGEARARTLQETAALCVYAAEPALEDRKSGMALDGAQQALVNLVPVMIELAGINLHPAYKRAFRL